ncbi:MAG: alpha/beta hydrolase [Microlunatus sp.]|nr:alpha/beta hydrolase [Microlunatus sp.]
MKIASGNIIATAMGMVEVEEHGSGVPVLLLHGSPGGIDAARAMGRFLPRDRFRAIALSRPGYLGTPLDPADTSIDHEADLLAAVLDTLGVERAGVLAWSGGGPSAYRLAVRHPDRVCSIVAIAAVSSRSVAPQPTATQKFLFGTPVGQWLIRFFARRAPGSLVGGALANEGSVRGEELHALTAGVLADLEKRAAVLTLATTVGIAGARKAGLDNDIANFARIDSLELQRVACPVLLIHGDADSGAPIDHSRSADDALPRSRLIVMRHGTHLAFFAHPDAARVQEQARRWLTDSFDNTPQGRTPR